MKKLLNILSSLSLTSVGSLSLVACKNQMPKLSLLDKENYIVQAINDHEISNPIISNSLKIDDILSVAQILISWKSEHLHFTYDINLKNFSQSQNIITQKYLYLNPEVQGHFDILNNKFSNNKVNILQNINNNYQNILPHSNLLVGTTNDFIAIFDADSWNRILDEPNEAYFIISSLNILNSNINLSSQDWTKIARDPKVLLINDGYSFLMHVVNKQIVYDNIDDKGNTNMSYVDKGEHIENNCTKFNQNNYQFLLTNDLLLELNDMFNYQQNLWTDDSIQNLINDKMWLTNANLDETIKNLEILFTYQNNLNVIHQLLNNNVHDSFAINIINNKASVDYPNSK